MRNPRRRSEPRTEGNAERLPRAVGRRVEGWGWLSIARQGGARGGCCSPTEIIALRGSTRIRRSPGTIPLSWPLKGASRSSTSTRPAGALCLPRLPSSPLHPVSVTFELEARAHRNQRQTPGARPKPVVRRRVARPARSAAEALLLPTPRGSRWRPPTSSLRNGGPDARPSEPLTTSGPACERSRHRARPDPGPCAGHHRPAT
jgi:hypothetical protein